MDTSHICYNKYSHITSFTSINASGLKRNPILSSSRIKWLYIETMQEVCQDVVLLKYGPLQLLIFLHLI